jgi:tetratricopeptide (TPR) repeat protein
MARRTARSRENAPRQTQMVLRQSQGVAEAAAKQLTPRSRMTLAFIVFVVIFAGITIASFRLQSPTFDEPIHLLGGYSYLKWNDFRINPEHPPLVKIWAALPLLGLDINDPRPYTPYWDLVLKVEPGGPFSPLVREMFFVRNDAESLFFLAKLQMLVLSVVLALFIFLWSYELYGFKAALVSLCLYGLDPNIIAHSTIIHSDLPFALFFFLSSYFVWRVLNQFSWPNVVLTVLAFAMASITKHSFVAIFLVWGVPGLINLFRSAPQPSNLAGSEWLSSRQGKLVLLIGLFASAVAASYLAIWAAYGFRFSAVPEAGRPLFMTQIDSPFGPVVETIRAFVLEHRLLPEALVAGYSYNLKIWKHTAYLLGNISDDGFWSYFPIAFAVKTPLPTLVLLATGMGMWLFKRRRLSVDLWLIVPTLIYFSLAVFSRFNLGLRHLLPIYPLLFVLLGGITQQLWQTRSSALRAGLIVLGLWYLGSLLASYPHYLSYFNELAGGPKNGHKVLLDSNLDWGQGLKGLKQWMDGNKVQKIQMLYFGVGYPKYYGIEDFFGRENIERRSFPPGDDLELPEHLAVSANFYYAGEVYLPKEMNEWLRSYKLGQPIATISHSILVFKINRDDSQAYYNAAFMMAREGGLAAAVNLYRQALKINPRHRHAHLNLGNALALQGNFAEATRHYHEALRIEPRFPEAHESFGRMLAAQGEDDRAVEEFRQALRLRPDFPEAHQSLSRIYRRQGKIKEAIEHAEAALRIMKATRPRQRQVDRLSE